MLRRTPYIFLAIVILFSASLACSLPNILVLPAPASSPTPQVVMVVATSTPGPLPPADSADSVEARRIAVYERVSPAVVNITTQVLRSNFFWGTVPEEGSGSGFLWDREGHIVTNYHVVQGAQTVEVSFGGDVAMPATVIGADPLNDLAVIKVDSVPAGVEPIEVGNSGNLKVGQTAIAIGNPFGQFERTLTVGVISALNRTIETDSTVLRGVIQTDAAINRGNSGGPLLDSTGRLIGVNSAIYSPSGTSAGVGLAIPVDKVRRVIPVLLKEGRYPHPWLGIEGLGYEISPALARGLNLPVERGLLVARLYQDSPADQAGLRTAKREVVVGNRRYLVGGDVITTVDGKPAAKWEDLNGYLEEHTEVGQTITLTVVRDGKEMTIKATLADTPESLQGN
ncbi:MAG: trypsin-like peptidase domain-containing protein [Chloroflexi bacterium]|nr:trypsin-like peptidase domain-containing protein [Chloroflexota bacterium]